MMDGLTDEGRFVGRVNGENTNGGTSEELKLNTTLQLEMQGTFRKIFRVFYDSCINDVVYDCKPAPTTSTHPSQKIWSPTKKKNNYRNKFKGLACLRNTERPLNNSCLF